MKSVYLTYSGHNCEAVLQTMELLIRNGYGLMCECMLPYGTDPAEQAHRMICEADAVIAVITHDAVDCPYMARDLAWAKEAKAKLLSVVVGDAPLPHGLGTACMVSEYPAEGEMAGVQARLKDILG